MLDIFDLLSPRVYVVSEESLKKRRLAVLQDKKKLYEEALTVVQKEIDELVD